MKYMREGLADDYGIVKLQDKILEIMVDVDAVCRKNDIKYCIMGGTALGAARHGGFIPWDDDLDIFMEPAQFEKFRACFAQLPAGKYTLCGNIDAHGHTGLTKVRMNGTTYIEPLCRHRTDMHQGIYIDIFILHNLPDNHIARRWQYLWCRYLVLLGLAHCGYNRRGGIYRLILGLMRCLPVNFLRQYAMEQAYCWDDGRLTKQKCHFMGKARYQGGRFDAGWFATLKEVPFETVNLFAPAGLHEYLCARFGDYMKHPSPAQIKWEQHAEIWDTERDYSFYVNGEHDQR